VTKTELIKGLKILLKAEYDTDNYRVKELQASELVKKARSTKMKDNPPKDRLSLIDIIASFLLSLLYGGIAFIVSYPAIFVLQIISEWILGVSFDPIAISTLNISIVIGSLIAFGFWGLLILASKDSIKKDSKNIIKYNKQVEYLHENIQQFEKNHVDIQEEYARRIYARDALRKKVGLHPDYCEPWTIKGLIDVLEHGRADTLKEAINLYERESHQAQRELEESRARIRQRQLEEYKLQELRNIRSESSRAADAAEEASRNAEEAAFWGEVNAYLAYKNSK